MIWFLLFLAVLGIAWFLFVPRSVDETALPMDGDRPFADTPDGHDVTPDAVRNLGAHATGTVEPTLRHPADLFTADGTDMPIGQAVVDDSTSGQAEGVAGQDAVAQNAVEQEGPYAAGEAADWGSAEATGEEKTRREDGRTGYSQETGHQASGAYDQPASFDQWESGEYDRPASFDQQASGEYDRPASFDQPESGTYDEPANFE
nr:MAG: hypothetical protein DIU55_06150 [Bacillota bacterium]